MNELMTITPPNGDRAVAQKMHDYVVERERALRAEFEAVAAKLTPEGYAETKAEWTRLKKIDAELKEIVEKVEASAFAFSATDALLFQLNATRKNLKQLYTASWAKYTELRDAGKPAPEAFEYVCSFVMPDADFAKMAAKWQKDGLMYRARRVADNEHAKIAKLFGEETK